MFKVVLIMINDVFQHKILICQYKKLILKINKDFYNYTRLIKI
jgi:hypothetical protein